MFTHIHTIYTICQIKSKKKRRKRALKPLKYNYNEQKKLNFKGQSTASVFIFCIDAWFDCSNVKSL